jgi:hypothetical protein
MAVCAVCAIRSGQTIGRIDNGAQSEGENHVSTSV